MEDNMVLIKEINKLRRELKTNHKKYENLASAFKAKGSKNNTVKQVKSNNLKKSGAISNAVEKQYKEHINVSARIYYLVTLLVPTIVHIVLVRYLVPIWLIAIDYWLYIISIRLGF